VLWIHFESVAVTKKFKGRATEIEAIEPGKLRDLCENCITRHIDDHAFEQLQLAEDAERKTLSMMIEDYTDAA